MLQIKNIQKKYITGSLVQTALDGVSTSFRDNEFVAILGPSGSGKTTLLNIIGGLDRYDSGDLVINGISTKKYSDRDWDSYRNHTIGFVFQSYNLIPHQSVLANVELALTISGISRKERRKRASEALEKVGLGNQLHKKPNQMSGGQMQRVAIARALVNNPDILLADEPTGALDSETSVQVMELLKEVAKTRLVVMVTHNPELAEQYATRIVKLRDGKITEDTNPFDASTEKNEAPIHKNMGKSSMSFWTALSLSFKNLLSKKGRTILTSFAGSIGIIGIALILALSTGVNKYIADIQKSTMTSYPITISSETVDVSGLMQMGGGGKVGDKETVSAPTDGIYADNSELKTQSTLASSILKNNLTSFKKYLDNPESEINKYLGENGVVYSYNVSFDVYSSDADGKTINTDADAPTSNGSQNNGFSSMMSGMTMLSGQSSTSAKNFKELMKGKDSTLISSVVTDSYGVVYGKWADSYDEVVLILDENNTISSTTLYQLGFITSSEYKTLSEKITAGETVEPIKIDYAEACKKTFSLVPACDQYIKNSDGTFTFVGDNALYTNSLTEKAIELKIVGVVKAKEDAQNASIRSAVGYTSLLTDHVISHTDASEIVLAQELTPETNVLNGIKFVANSDSEKAGYAKSYLSKLNVSEKATFYTMLMNSMGGTTSGAGGTTLDESAKAMAFDVWLSTSADEKTLVAVYNQYVSGGSYEDNMKAFGKVSYDAPSSISIYTDSFDDKEAVSTCIANYNKTVSEDNKITYTDYVALLTSSITSIVNVISYVLIAFVGVSLVVSCIMIGIITHISVMERTKEIGVLRAIGASKGNISEVFNAETFIIGLCSGVLGIIISEILIVPINAIIHALTGLTTISAFLAPVSALVLIGISLVITLLGGLIPSSKAAKKDPVIALRTE